MTITTQLQYYTLSAFQEATLTEASNGKFVVFHVLESSATDTPEDKANHDKEIREMNELILVGLAQDISAMFRENINHAIVEHKRGFKAYAVTEMGLKMFHRHGKRVVN